MCCCFFLTCQIPGLNFLCHAFNLPMHCTSSCKLPHTFNISLNFLRFCCRRPPNQKQPFYNIKTNAEWPKLILHTHHHYRVHIHSVMCHFLRFQFPISDSLFLFRFPLSTMSQFFYTSLPFLQCCHFHFLCNCLLFLAQT